MLHSPGLEVENMTPQNAQRALYSDILNLSIAQQEYSQVEGVLSKVAKVYKVHDMLVKVLNNADERQHLIGKICITEQATDYYELLDRKSTRLNSSH